MSRDICGECRWVPETEGHKPGCSVPEQELQDRVEALELRVHILERFIERHVPSFEAVK